MNFKKGFKLFYKKLLKAPATAFKSKISPRAKARSAPQTRGDLAANSFISNPIMFYNGNFETMNSSISSFINNRDNDETFCNE